MDQLELTQFSIDSDSENGGFLQNSSSPKGKKLKRQTNYFSIFIIPNVAVSSPFTISIPMIAHAGGITLTKPSLRIHF